jgi:hypothetical protein
MNILNKKLGIAIAIVLYTLTFATAYATTAEQTNGTTTENPNVTILKTDEPTAERIDQLKEIAM